MKDKVKCKTRVDTKINWNPIMCIFSSCYNKLLQIWGINRNLLSYSFGSQKYELSCQDNIKALSIFLLYTLAGICILAFSSFQRPPALPDSHSFLHFISQQQTIFKFLSNMISASTVVSPCMILTLLSSSLRGYLVIILNHYDNPG